MNINERIRMLREEKSLSRAAFGQRLGVSGDVINNLERGRVEPKDHIIKLICAEFSISEKWLRTGEGEMPKDDDIDFGAACAKIGVSDERAKKVIMGYYSLSPQDKELLWSFIEKLKKITE